MRLIAFAGLKGSGKDTAAGIFVEQGFAHVKMAGALKLMLRKLLEYQGASPEQVDRMIDGDEKELDSFLLGGRSPRHAMKTLGTEWARDLMTPDFWVQMTRNKIEGIQGDVVVSDIRFPNEVDMIHALGGQVFRIDRPGTDTSDLHPSEAKILELEVDLVINNHWPTAQDFGFSIFQLFGLADYTPPVVRPAPANDRPSAEEILGHFRGPASKPVPYA